MADEIIKSTVVVDLSQFRAKVVEVEQRVDRSDRRLKEVKVRAAKLQQELAVAQATSQRVTQQLRQSVISLGASQLSFALSNVALSSFDLDQSSFLGVALVSGVPAILTGLATGGPAGALFAGMATIFTGLSSSLRNMQMQITRNVEFIQKQRQRTEELERGFERRKAEEDRVRDMAEAARRRLDRLEVRERIYQTSRFIPRKAG